MSDRTIIAEGAHAAVLCLYRCGTQLREQRANLIAYCTLDVRVQPVDVQAAGDSDVHKALLERAAGWTDSWYEHGLETYRNHPSWPIACGAEPEVEGLSSNEAPQGIPDAKRHKAS